MAKPGGMSQRLHAGLRKRGARSLLDDVSPESQSAQDANKFYEKLQSNLKKFEEAAKGLGGVAGAAMGAYGIFDGVQAIRNGDKLGGGFSIAAGTTGALAGLASAVEGGLSLLGTVVPRAVSALAGAFGWAAAGAAALAALIPQLATRGSIRSRSMLLAHCSVAIWKNMRSTV